MVCNLATNTWFHCVSIMAADPGPSNKSAKNTDEAIVIDEKLDFFSEKFDPLSFLQSREVKIPKPEAKVFDNLAVWNSHFERGGEARKSSKKQENTALPERRWLPHQLPVQSTRPTRIAKNVFTRMNTVQGPLALLRKYVEEKTRIKIITRNDKGIRGYCTALLLAFDKHFNLILEEVDEVWRRSIKVKKNAVLDLDESKEKKIDTISRNRVTLPPIKTKRISKNTEECTRHVEQMLMRGEHVVLICTIEK